MSQASTAESALLAKLSQRLAIQDFVQRSARLLDDEDLTAWLDLFDDPCEYELCAYSTELRRLTVWWRADRALLAQQMQDVNQHVRDPAQRLHLVSPPTVELNGNTAHANATFTVYRTIPSGETTLYVAGRYEDALVLRDGQWRYSRHRAIVHTRVLDTFTHLPI